MPEDNNHNEHMPNSKRLRVFLLAEGNENTMDLFLHLLQYKYGDLLAETSEYRNNATDMIKGLLDGKSMSPPQGCNVYNLLRPVAFIVANLVAETVILVKRN